MKEPRQACTMMLHQGFDRREGLPVHESLCRFAVRSYIVNENDLFRECRRDREKRLLNGLKNSFLGFGEVHLLREEKSIKMLLQTICLVDEVKMQVVAVGEQVHRMSGFAQTVYERETFERQVCQHTHPRREDVLLGSAGTTIVHDLRDEGFGRDQTTLKIRHQLFGSDTYRFDSFSLRVHAQDRTHVRLTHKVLEGVHATLDIQVNQYASEIKDIRRHGCLMPWALYVSPSRRMRSVPLRSILRQVFPFGLAEERFSMPVAV